MNTNNRIQALWILPLPFQAGDLDKVQDLLKLRLKLVAMNISAGNEHRAIHYAVLAHNLTWCGS